MNATTLYRLAAGILVFFAAAHTYGFMGFIATTADGLAVEKAMSLVFFRVDGKLFSYRGLYLGFGLCVSVYLLFSAYLAWHLGNMAANNPRSIGLLGWIFCAMQAASLMLNWLYLFPATTVLSVGLTLCLAAAAWRVK